MSKRYFEFKGMRYDIGTRVKLSLENGETKETYYLGFGRFENVPMDAEASVLEVLSPKYYVEKK